METKRLFSGFNWKKLPRYIAIALIIAAGMLLAVRLLDLLMVWGLYSWFFQSLTRVGGINEYIAGAASIWFTAVVLLLIPIALSSFLFRRRIKGLLITSACFSLWFVILYFLSQPKEGNYFNTITGVGRMVWFKDPQEKIRILPLGYKFDPHYGIKTQLITSPIVIDYEKQIEQERREAEKKRVQSIPSQPMIEPEKKPIKQRAVITKTQVVTTEQPKATNAQIAVVEQVKTTEEIQPSKEEAEQQVAKWTKAIAEQADAVKISQRKKEEAEREAAKWTQIATEHAKVVEDSLVKKEKAEQWAKYGDRTGQIRFANSQRLSIIEYAHQVETFQRKKVEAEQETVKWSKIVAEHTHAIEVSQHKKEEAEQQLAKWSKIVAKYTQIPKSKP